jgi:RimJ/RimL family protein N-acetyltransferase
MNFTIQPILESKNIILHPLQEHDFEALHLAASNPEIWEQHPNKNRWQKEVFKNFFEGAMQSNGAFKVIDKTRNKIIGSTRFYDYNESKNSIFIGYTFYVSSCGILAAARIPQLLTY